MTIQDNSFDCGVHVALRAFNQSFTDEIEHIQYATFPFGIKDFREFRMYMLQSMFMCFDHKLPVFADALKNLLKSKQIPQ